MYNSFKFTHYQIYYHDINAYGKYKERKTYHYFQLYWFARIRWLLKTEFSRNIVGSIEDNMNNWSPTQDFVCDAKCGNDLNDHMVSCDMW